MAPYRKTLILKPKNKRSIQIEFLYSKGKPYNGIGCGSCFYYSKTNHNQDFTFCKYCAEAISIIRNSGEKATRIIPKRLYNGKRVYIINK